jgi:hypothetical protein
MLADARHMPCRLLYCGIERLVAKNLKFFCYIDIVPIAVQVVETLASTPHPNDHFFGGILLHLLTHCTVPVEIKLEHKRA